MSSAILYLAIVAIWACVLIPRWLKRDSARSVTTPATLPAPVPAEPAEREETLADDPDDLPAPAPVHLSQPLSPEESRRRMLAARRRLLLMLIGLEAAAVALAVLGLAAVWVVIPPSLMLGGYLLLLREAAKADAEMAAREAEAVLRNLERDRERMYTHQARPDPRDNITTDAEELTAKFAAAPVPADHEDTAPGRDFAPGLAGKYTTSNAGAGTEEKYHASYEAPARLRAVGD